MNQKMSCLFWGVLFFLCFCNKNLFAITKETAIDRCASNIEFLKKAPISFEDRELESVFQKIVNRLVLTLDGLKKTDDPKEIYVHRTVCDNGYKAVQWIVENFSSVVKIEKDKKEDQQTVISHDKESKTKDDLLSNEKGSKNESNHVGAHAHSASHQESALIKSEKAAAPEGQKETSSDLVKNDDTVKNNKEVKKTKTSKKKASSSAKAPLKKTNEEG